MKKIRLIPPLLTFGAGTIASIILFFTNYDWLTMLIILFVVLVVFYVLGVIAMKVFMDCSAKEIPDESETETTEANDAENADVEAE